MEGSRISKDIVRCIVESAETYNAPDGKNHSVINLKIVASIAGSRRISAEEVEITALKQGIIPKRYLRNIGTIGLDGQIKLLQAIVAVVGVGGLGGTIVELLARQGVGHLIIIDNDCFTEQNLNRQIMSKESNLGEYKTIVAARRAGEINSTIKVTTFLERLTSENAQKLLSGAQVVADGLDNLPARLAVEHACRCLRIPYVYGTIAGFSGQLMSIFPDDVGLSSIYGSSNAILEQGIETKIGNPSAMPTMIAAMEVQEVVKIITGVGKPVRNQILLVDATECTIDRIELRR